MKAYLSVKRTTNLKTGEYQDTKRWIALEPEQTRAFCKLFYSHASRKFTAIKKEVCPDESTRFR